MPHNIYTRLAMFLLIALNCGGVSGAAFAQANTTKAAPATISGRVTSASGASDNKGLAGVSVALNVTRQQGNQRPRNIARVTTDAEGRYTLTNIPPGHYQIMVIAPVFVMQDAGRWWSGKPLDVLAGEFIEDINFELERGGVITGRVTDADGKPVISEFVNLTAEDRNNNGTVGMGNPYMYQTDDRGIYRIYGLSAGHYRVSVGQGVAGVVGVVRTSGGARRIYQRTFYPGTSEMSEARLVEVTPGGEATDIDIALGTPAKTFKIAGRVVNAETGQSVPGITLAVGTMTKGGRASFGNGTQTNERGEFEFGNLMPGHYFIFLSPRESASEFYGDSTTFEIKEADVSGVEVKLHRGLTVSGQVVVEGLGNRATLARLLSQVVLAVGNDNRKNSMPLPPSTIKPAPDGSFSAGGLRPGRVQIYTGWPAVKGLTLLRVERDGVDQGREGVQVAEGAPVAGVRVIFTYGNASIRGQLRIVNGTLTPQSGLSIYVTRPGSESVHFNGRRADVDARGRFAIEGLPAGDYELIVQAYAPGKQVQQTKERVTLAEDGETTLAPVLDLSAWNPEVKP